MATAFRTVQSAIVTALLTPANIVGSRVYAGRDRPLPTEHDSDIQVFIGSFRGEEFALTGGPMQWSMRYGLQIRARGGSGTDAEAAVDTVLEAAFARLKATAPPAGVEGWVIDVDGRIEVQDVDTPIGTLALSLGVRLRTQPGSLTLAS